MRRAAFLVLALGFVLSLGWGLTAGAPDAPDPLPEAPPGPTPEAARAALIDLIQSPDPGELKDFPLDRFAGAGAEAGPDDAASWGPFALDLRRREYTFDRGFGQPPRVCRWHYRGAFEL